MIGIIDTSSLLAIARYYLSIKDEAKLLLRKVIFQWGEIELDASVI